MKSTIILGTATALAVACIGLLGDTNKLATVQESFFDGQKNTEHEWYVVVGTNLSKRVFSVTTPVVTGITNSADALSHYRSNVVIETEWKPIVTQTNGTWTIRFR